jgi:hypothetical protein
LSSKGWLIAVLVFPALAHAGELGVNVYGLSRHLDRAKARELHVDNELNPGLARARPGTRASTCASPARSPSSRATPTFVYFPKLREINSIATVGFWLTLWPGGW